MSFSLFLSLPYPLLLLPLHPDVLPPLSSSLLFFAPSPPPLFFLPLLPSPSLPVPPLPRRTMWAGRGILPPTMFLPRLHSPTLLPPPQTAAQPAQPIGIITAPGVPVKPGVLRSTTHRPVLSSTAVHRVGAVGGFPCARPTA